MHTDNGGRAHEPKWMPAIKAPGDSARYVCRVCGNVGAVSNPTMLEVIEESERRCEPETGITGA